MLRVWADDGIVHVQDRMWERLEDRKTATCGPAMARIIARQFAAAAEVAEASLTAPEEDNGE